MANFAITGVAGYIAPRHLKAITETGNTLVAALDPHDSVGILDRFSHNARFFTEPERFDRHLEKLRRIGEEERVHWFSICAPNYLHDAHIRMAFRLNANAICEKPLVLNPWNLDALQELEAETGQRVFTVLQLRVHPQILALRERIRNSHQKKKHEIELTYITPRGPWYLSSWKGNLQRAGGLATNIGIHFFDFLLWIFGEVNHHEVHIAEEKRTAGFLDLERANVKWYLSLDEHDSPVKNVDGNSRTYRCISIDNEPLEFTHGFTDLHTEIYQQTLDGNGFGIDDTRATINLIHNIRFANPIGWQPHSHSMVHSLEEHA
jgi:UDP-N-acetyl-2-amino-2-deoxyglucuronate dehydrogenase